MSNDRLCPLPFTHVCQTIDGRLKPCCRFQMKAGDQNRPHLKKTSIGGAFESDYFETIRTAMLNGEKVDGCVRCYEEESIGIKSYRQFALRRYPFATEKPRLTYLELAFSNECNLKCRMCNPSESRKWNSDWEKLFPNRLDDISKYEWSLANDAANFADLSYVKIVGGEPFLSSEFEAFLKTLCSLDLAKSITMDCHTNSTFFPKPEIRNYLKQFKAFNAFLSIDAVGPLAEYIRCGVSWDKVSTTATKWVHLMTENENVEVIIYPTFQTYNAHAIGELADWAHSIGIKSFGGNFVNEPQYLSVDILPENYRESLLKKYREKDLNHFESSYKTSLSHLMSRLDEKRLEPNLEKDLFRQFVNFDSKLSELRSQSLLKVAPELYELTL